AILAVTQKPESFRWPPNRVPEKAAMATQIGLMSMVGTVGARMETAVIMATVPEPWAIFISEAISQASRTGWMETCDMTSVIAPPTPEAVRTLPRAPPGPVIGST